MSNTKKRNVKVINEIVLVEWVDAEGDCGWSDMSDVDKWAKKAFVVREIGWILEDNEEHLVLTSELGDENLIGNRTKIPKPWIISRRTVKINEKRRTKK